MYYLDLRNGTITIHLVGNTSFISIVKAKIVTPRVNYTNILLYFLHDQYENVMFIPNY